MNYFFPIFCVAAAGVAGYVLEPSLRSSLTGRTTVKIVMEELPPERADPPRPTPPPGETVKPPVTPPPVVQKDPDPAPTPPPVVQKDPDPVPEPPPVAQKDPEPTPEPTPEPAPVTPPAGTALGAEDIVKVMQESIRSKQVKEFTFEQVLGWKAGDEETVDGEKYQTGLAAYKAETIFGVKTIQAKALIQGGQVKKWIWPNSGMEIK